MLVPADGEYGQDGWVMPSGLSQEEQQAAIERYLALGLPTRTRELKLIGSMNGNQLQLALDTREKLEQTMGMGN